MTLDHDILVAIENRHTIPTSGVACPNCGHWPIQGYDDPETCCPICRSSLSIIPGHRGRIRIGLRQDGKVVWGSHQFNYLDQALSVLLMLMRQGDVANGAINHRTAAGTYLEIVEVTRYPRQDPGSFWEWLKSLNPWSKEPDDVQTRQEDNTPDRGS